MRCSVCGEEPAITRCRRIEDNVIFLLGYKCFVIMEQDPDAKEYEYKSLPERKAS